jgi:peptidylprolyl isomerase
MTKPLTILLSIAALAVGLAACGSSKKAPGVQLAPSAGATADTTTANTVTTPKVPPALSKEPTVTVPKGPAPGHLVIKDLIKGSGPAATPSSTVEVNYVGVVYKTGKQFDSSWSRGQPTSFQLTGLIKGWSEGMTGMRVGGRRELIIPPGLAYGKAGRPPTIPPNSTLIFVVDLLSAS